MYHDVHATIVSCNRLYLDSRLSNHLGKETAEVERAGRAIDSVDL